MAQDSALIAAIKNGNIKDIQYFIQSNPKSISEHDENGVTALHLAVSLNRKEAVQALIAAGANVNTEDKEGRRPLHYAVYNNNAEMVETLIQNKAEPNATDNYGHTPLHAAAYKDAVASANMLLEHGANPNKLNKEKRSPLHLTSSENMLSTLIQHGANKNEADAYKRTAEDYLYANKQIKLHDVVEKQVRQAIENNDSKALATLVASGAYKQVDNPEKPLLFEYMRTAAKEKDTNKINQTLQTFKDAGVSMNQQDARGNTLFHVATEPSLKGGEQLIQKAKELGGDPEKKNNVGTAPVHYAAYNSNQEAMSALKEAGADIKATDKYDKQAIHIAALQGNSQMIDSLLHAGADINAETDEDKTPLHYAKDEKTASVLLKWGANPTIKDEHDKLPGDYIEKNTGKKLSEIASETVMDAVQKGETDSLKGMMASGAYLMAAKDGKTPVEQIIAQNDTKAYETLSTTVSDYQKNLNAFARKNNAVRMPDPTKAIITAIENKSYDVLEELAKKNKSAINRMVLETDGKRKRPLHTAIEQGDAKAIEILLNHDARASDRLLDHNNRTAEDLCLAKYKMNLSEFLKQEAAKEATQKAKPDAKEAEGEKTEDSKPNTQEAEGEKTEDSKPNTQEAEGEKKKDAKPDAKEAEGEKKEGAKPDAKEAAGEKKKDAEATAQEEKGQPKTVHAYSQAAREHAQKRLKMYEGKGKNVRLNSSGKETALKNLKRMEELGLVAGGKESSNADILLYKMAQANALYSPNGNVIAKNEKGQPTRVKMTDYMKGNHRAALAALSSKELSDEELAKYAQTVNAVETSISDKGFANLNMNGVQGRYSYNTSKQAGFVEEKAPPKEQEAKPTKTEQETKPTEDKTKNGKETSSSDVLQNKIDEATNASTKITIHDSPTSQTDYTLGGSTLKLGINTDYTASIGGSTGGLATLRLNADKVNLDGFDNNTLTQTQVNGSGNGY